MSAAVGLVGPLALRRLVMLMAGAAAVVFLKCIVQSVVV